MVTSMGSYSSEIILLFGAYDQQLVNNGEIWRLLTYAIGHMSYFHFILNIPILIYLCLPFERILGSLNFLLIYIYLSCFAAIFILFFSGYSIPLAGSSGPGYGLLGMYLVLIFPYKDMFSPFFIRFIIICVILGFMNTFIVPDISIAGHVGGLIGGIILSVLFVSFKLKRLTI
ncbi:rhomboid family intramembrane serine protease [Tenuibacillus multivorans]|nr:rhomboid family intramembrane serine protease [Tenuibacillus multivorans]GEL78366.1 hypothetical protein TMU01_26010 [Tenuibacillus multivorans]